MHQSCSTIRFLRVMPLMGALATCGIAADPTTAVITALQSANQARSDLARLNADWVIERQRLEALIAATNSETARMERAATTAEAARDVARARLAALGSAADLDAVRAALATAGEHAGAALNALALTLPPGVLPTATTGGDEPFALAVRALESAEQAAGRIAVEVVTGELGTQRQAVKILRVAGAAAWWVALDGTQAGTVAMSGGKVVLTPVDEPALAAIISALAQAEGRQTPTITLLPVVRP